MEQLTEWLLQTLPSIAAHGHWVYAIVFLSTIIESTPVLGTFTPGTLFLLFYGYLAGQGYGVLGIYIIFVTLGGVLGDVFAYLLGKYGKRFFKEHNKILKLGHLETAKAFFHRHGGKSILFGRFVGVVRPMVPLVAGSVGMSWKKFLGWNVLSAVLWASLYLLLGFFFGKNFKYIDDIVSNIGILLTFILIAGALIYWKKNQIKAVLKKYFL